VYWNRHYCSELNPDTVFEVHNMDVSAPENLTKLKETIATGALDRKSPVNLIISCLDNMEARQAVESVSEQLQAHIYIN